MKNSAVTVWRGNATHAVLQMASLSGGVGSWVCGEAGAGNPSSGSNDHDRRKNRRASRRSVARKDCRATKPGARRKWPVWRSARSDVERAWTLARSRATAPRERVSGRADRCTDLRSAVFEARRASVLAGRARGVRGLLLPSRLALLAGLPDVEARCPRSRARGRAGAGCAGRSGRRLPAPIIRAIHQVSLDRLLGLRFLSLLEPWRQSALLSWCRSSAPRSSHGTRTGNSRLDDIQGSTTSDCPVALGDPNGSHEPGSALERRCLRERSKEADS